MTAIAPHLSVSLPKGRCFTHLLTPVNIRTTIIYTFSSRTNRYPVLPEWEISGILLVNFKCHPRKSQETPQGNVRRMSGRSQEDTKVGLLENLLANTPKVAFIKLSRWKYISVGPRGVCPYCDRIVNSEH